MDAKQIRFFLEVARTGSFTSAAKKLFISVPGLVKSMDKLEDELGAPLFVRQRTGVRVSPAGRAFDEAARRLMGEDVPLELPKVRPQFSRRLKSSIRVLRGAQEPEREE